MSLAIVSGATYDSYWTHLHYLIVEYVNRNSLSFEIKPFFLRYNVARFFYSLIIRPLPPFEFLVRSNRNNDVSFFLIILYILIFLRKSFESKLSQNRNIF